MPCARPNRRFVPILLVAMAEQAVMMPLSLGSQMEMRTLVIG